MTVEQLITTLSSYPQDMQVYFEGAEDTFFPVEYAETIETPDMEPITVLQLGSFISLKDTP